MSRVLENPRGGDLRSTGRAEEVVQNVLENPAYSQKFTMIAVTQVSYGEKQKRKTESRVKAAIYCL